MHDPTAVPATFEDYDRSIASLVAAFICDPFIRWMFPDSKQYFHYFPLVLKDFAGGAFDHSSAYRSSDFNAAACGDGPASFMIRGWKWSSAALFVQGDTRDLSKA